jgi:hypothetical protein
MNICQKIWNWCIQFLTLFFLIYLIILLTNGEKFGMLKGWILALFLISYLSFLITFLRYKLLKFVKNIKPYNEVEPYFQTLFTSQPAVRQVVQSYHIGEDERGMREKKITHVASEEFKFNHFRDCSGPLDLTSAVAAGRNIVKLYLTCDFEIADEETRKEFEKEKRVLVDKHDYRDAAIEDWDTCTIQGMKRYNILCITESQPCFLNVYFYLLLTIIPVTKFYELIVNRYLYKIEFTVKKFISRYDDLKSSSKYGYLDPVIVFNIDEARQVIKSNRSKKKTAIEDDVKEVGIEIVVSQESATPSKRDSKKGSVELSEINFNIAKKKLK